jgi:hypothetical protein
MQNRYVGDIGDFAKYALLRCLGTPHEFRLGIVWCLFGDESHNADGRHTGYLGRPEFRSLDPQLHDRLNMIVNSGHRSIEKICRARIFPRHTVFFDLPVMALGGVRGGKATREAYRRNWLSEALAATAGSDLVFFDPDNGLEVSSVPRHAPKAGKYVFWDELELFWTRGQSLIIYHHLNRRASVREQTAALKRAFVDRFSDASMIRCLLFRRGSCRHFWIVGQELHCAALESKIEALLGSGWAGYFEVG